MHVCWYLSAFYSSTAFQDIALLLFLQEGEVYVYRVSATGVDGTSFSAKIRVPGLCGDCNNITLQLDISR